MIIFYYSYTGKHAAQWMLMIQRFVYCTGHVSHIHHLKIVTPAGECNTRFF